MDGETFSEHDYGLVITTSSKTAELEQMIKQNAQAVYSKRWYNVYYYGYIL
jgi:hypothetical protein